MLPRVHRLRLARDLRRVQRQGAAFRNPRLTLRVVRRRDQLPPRIAVAVGRRVSVRATDRNKVTRWIREALRSELPKISSGTDLRFSATAAFAHYSFPQCVEDVRSLCKRAGIVRESE